MVYLAAVALPVAMLGPWCPIDVTRMDVWERSTEQVVETAPECMMVTATGYRGMEDGCKFIRIQREGDNYVVRMQCDSAGDCEFTGRRLKQCVRNRPVSTSVFRLDGDRLITGNDHRRRHAELFPLQIAGGDP